jgi:hypothetical protein
MMRKIEIKAAATAAPPAASNAHMELSEEDRSKDAFFARMAEIADAMIARHGKEFAMGTLLLSARFIAEGRPLSNRTHGGEEKGSIVKPV